MKLLMIYNLPTPIIIIFIFFIAFLSSLIYSSNKLLSYPINKIFGAQIFHCAQPIIPTTTNFRLLTLFYNIYIYMVFDISYIRITLPGKYLKFHSIHFYIIFLLKICLYLFHPIIRWLFYLKYIFTNKKPYSF